MKMELYSIKDKLSGYAAPIPYIDCNNAKRHFRTQLVENKFMANNKNDYELYYMGTFDSDTGEIKATNKLVEKGEPNGIPKTNE